MKKSSGRLLFWISLFIIIVPTIVLGKTHSITRIEIQGANRTDQFWVKSYLELDSLPLNLDDSEIEGLQSKLKTTDVFKEVSFALVKEETNPAQEILHITLVEKWTTIPVVRAAYGGGTPLTVLGIYDTHSFGKLWTLGAETRRYGNAEPGGTIWARSPRWLTGKHAVSLELWLDRRLRTLYNRDTFDSIGELQTIGRKVRFHVLFPLSLDSKTPNKTSYQYGFDIQLRKLNPSIFSATQPEIHPSQLSIDISTPSSIQTRLFWAMVYDNIAIDGLTYDGVRILTNISPPILNGSQSKSTFELEAFYYNPLPFSVNFASHLFAASAPNDNVQNLYFLGGLDSIRGLPDNAIYGSECLYLNLELRKLIHKFRYIWIQGALFSDLGNTASSQKELAHEMYSTLGTGIRISFPYIHRFMIRLDYGFSLTNGNLRGINAGMNDFFQPYRPL